MNVEIHPKFKSDIQADMMDLKFESSMFKEIVARDVLDHVTYVQCIQLLKRIYEWLENNGTLRIHLPNLAFTGGLAAKGDHEATKWIYGTDGVGHSHYDTNLIRWGYTPKKMKELLEGLGFIIIAEFLDCFGFAFDMTALKRVE